MLTQTHNSFQEYGQLQALSEVNSDIIRRALQQSADAWAITGAVHDLQQVAHTVRLSFLTNLLHLDAGIHTRLDFLAISAAGQPLNTFHMPTQGATGAVPDPLQAFCLQPGWAGSDELYFIMQIYQPFVQHTMFAPCLQWNHQEGGLHCILAIGSSCHMQVLWWS